MKRHQRLQELSREHHGALQLALKARRAAVSGNQSAVEESAASCLAAFESALEPHFVVEETTLLPLLLSCGEDERVHRVVSEHRQLRRLVRQLQQPDATTLLGFAELLISHVRFEERELFVLIEAHFLDA